MTDTMDLRARLLLDNSSFDKGLKSTERQAKETAGKTTGAFGGMGGKIAAIAGFSVLAGGLFESVRAAQALAAQGRIQTQVLHNNGLAQVFNTKQLQTQAQALTMLTGQSTASIMSAQNLLLTNQALTAQYKQHPKFLQQTVTAAADLAALTHKSIEMTGKALGRALADPAKGLGALKRFGVALSAEQVLQIKNLEKQGNLTAAQALLLKDVGKATHGIAQKAADPMKVLMGTLQVLMDSVGKAILPLIVTIAKALVPLVSGLIPVIDAIGKTIGPLLQAIGGSIGKIIATLMPAINGILGTLGPLFITILKPIMAVITALAGPLVKVLMMILKVLAPVVTLLVNGLGKILLQLVKMLSPLINMLVNQFAKVLLQLQPLLMALANVILSVLTALMPLLPALIKLVMTILMPLLQLLVKLTPVITFLAKLLGAVLTAAIKILVGALTWIISGLTSVISAVAGFVANFSGFFNGLVSVISGVISAIVGFFVGLGTSVGNVVMQVVGFFIALPQEILNALRNIVTFIFRPFLLAGQWIYDHVIKPIVTFFVNLGTTLLNGISSIAASIWNPLYNFFVPIINAIIIAWDNTIGWLVGHINTISTAASRATNQVNNLNRAGHHAGTAGPKGTGTSSIAGALHKHPKTGAGRAAGGPVIAGMTYWVGEHGPELFTPNTSGAITSNSRVRQGAIGHAGGKSVNVAAGAIQITITGRVDDAMIRTIRRVVEGVVTDVLEEASA